MIKQYLTPVEPSEDDSDIPFKQKLLWFMAFAMLGLLFVATMAYGLRRILLLAQ